MYRIIILSFFIIINAPVISQSVLKPTIGVNQLPSDTESVCYIPMFTGSFYTSGIQVGDTASDFKLYNLVGDSIQLSTVLSSGKSALVIAGSYTCPVFRNKINSINNVVALYGSVLEVFVVYTLEAHPDIDTSVYFGYVNTGSQNINAGILYRQPTTYGERKTVVSEMLNVVNLNAQVYIDGPCNNWWNHYGPAPNNAYLINTNGIVFAKHGWYDKFPENIICDIDSLLGNPVSCPPTSTNGSFTFNLLSNDTIYDTPGSTITLEGELVNSNTQDVIVDVFRLINNLPATWASSLCIDVCYSTTTDSAAILLPAMTTLPFYFYIYTDGAIDTARARVGFRNRNNPSNQYGRNLFGITTATTTSIGSYEVDETLVNVYPNPVNSASSINISVNLHSCGNILTEMFDISGKRVSLADHGFLRSGTHELRISNQEVLSGIYLLRISSGGIKIHEEKIVIKY